MGTSQSACKPNAALLLEIVQQKTVLKCARIPRDRALASAFLMLDLKATHLLRPLLKRCSNELPRETPSFDGPDWVFRWYELEQKTRVSLYTKKIAMQDLVFKAKYKNCPPPAPALKITQNKFYIPSHSNI
jgi:hypothetical protein